MRATTTAARHGLRALMVLCLAAAAPAAAAAKAPAAAARAPAATAPEGAAAAPGTDDGEVREMSWVGFQQLADASRVFVKTTDPVAAHVDSSRPDVVVLTLDNTRVPLHNNTRPLETAYFASPVRRVEIKTIEGPSPSVRIEVQTRGAVAFKQVRKGVMVALDFPRPH